MGIHTTDPPHVTLYPFAEPDAAKLLNLVAGAMASQARRQLGASTDAPQRELSALPLEKAASPAVTEGAATPISPTLRGEETDASTEYISHDSGAT